MIVGEPMQTNDFKKIEGFEGLAVKLRHFQPVLLAFCLLTICTLREVAASGAPPEECYRAARYASHETTVPLNVLLAISRVETGRKIDGKVQPWPWAINHSGKGAWLSSEAELLETALKLIASGDRQFDVGCFQLNYHWHGREFQSLDEMISPRTNALYAARFLEALFSEFGDWTEAVGAYHSRTEALALSYKSKFLRQYNGAEEPEQRVATAERATKSVRSNSYPLLVAGTAQARLGSLVPSASR